MTKRRWKLGSYELEFNPKSDTQTMSETNNPRMTANGTISTNNLYYENQRSFSFDLFDKTTKFNKNSIKTFSSGYYISFDEDRISEELYCLRTNNTIDVISKNGTLARSFSIDLVAGFTAKCIAHMDDKLAAFYNDGSLVILDENGTQISKYTYSDIDIKDSPSITYNYLGNLYLLNKYGKVFKVVVADGISSLMYEANDFTVNKSNSLAMYKALHVVDYVYLGFIKSDSLVYLDKDFSPLYSTSLGKTDLVDISYGSYSMDFYSINSTSMTKLIPNICGIDIDKIKKEIANGIVELIDDNSNKRYFAVSDLSIQRQRNLQDSRYIVEISGQLI